MFKKSISVQTMGEIQDAGIGEVILLLLYFTLLALLNQN